MKQAYHLSDMSTSLKSLRLPWGGGLFYNDNAYNYQKVLKDAVAAYGIPSKLYVDYTDVLTIPTYVKSA